MSLMFPGDSRILKPSDVSELSGAHFFATNAGSTPLAVPFELIESGSGNGALFPGEYRILCCSLPSPLPAGWAEAGTAIDRSTPLGAQLITDGSPWGDGDGVNTVDLPPKEVFLLVAGANYPMGSTGGEIDHTLLTSELPAEVSRRDGNWLGNGPGGSGEAIGLRSIGGNQPHNNLPPYAAVNVMIYVGV